MATPAEPRGKKTIVQILGGEKLLNLLKTAGEIFLGGLKGAKRFSKTFRIVFFFNPLLYRFKKFFGGSFDLQTCRPKCYAAEFLGSQVPEMAILDRERTSEGEKTRRHTEREIYRERSEAGKQREESLRCKHIVPRGLPKTKRTEREAHCLRTEFANFVAQNAAIYQMLQFIKCY